MSQVMYDNSRLQTFKNCPEQHRLKYIEGLEKIKEGAEEHDRNFGKAIHAGLEAWYKGAEKEEAVRRFREAYPIQLDETDLTKTQENGAVILGKYFEHYELDKKRWKVLAVEARDQVEIVPGVMYTVKMDLVAENLEHGGIYFWDHKTTKKSLDYRYWSQFEPNAALTGYTFAIERKWGQCSGGIINGLSFGFRQRAYKGEPAGLHWAFQRQIFNRNQRQIEAWRLDTIEWIKKVEAERLKDGVHSKNEGACMYCSYRPICTACWDTKEDSDAIEVMYERVDPLAYLNSEGGVEE